jgi:glucose dehydrogenase
MAMKTFAIVLFAAIVASQLYSQGNWASYGYDQKGQRYSPLAQIDTKNVSKLARAWQYGIDPAASEANPENRTLTTSEAVPIVVDGMLYTPTLHYSIVALEPESGEEIWKFDLGKASGTLRGVTYWQGDKDHPPQILAGTGEGRLLALNAKTGKLISGFGKDGVVDLRAGVTDKFPNMAYHMSSPGAIYRNLIITGAQGKEDDPDGPAMDVRAWDIPRETGLDVPHDSASGRTRLRNLAEGQLVDRRIAFQLGRRYRR